MALASQLSLDTQLAPDHVMIADSDSQTVDLLSGYIQTVFPDAELIIKRSLNEVIEGLKELPVDFLILELDLPDSSGLETLHKVTPYTEVIPILVYAEKDNPELAIQAVQSGAQDYLIKGRGNALTFKRIIQHSLERKRLVLESKRNEQMLNTFIQYSPAGIAVFDHQFVLLMASDRWCADYGVVPEEAIGKRFTTLFDNDDEPKWRKLHRQCMEGEHIRCEEDEFITNDEMHHYIRWEMMPWFDINDKVGGIIQFTEFITEQRQILTELEDAKINLEQKVEARTRELEAAMMMAEQAGQAKEEFFASMTHELRTPLHAIINFSRFGIKRIDKASKEKIQEYFTDINRSGERLLGLVNDLLDLTKYQGARSEMNIARDSLKHAIENVIKEMSAIAESKEITIAQEIEEGYEYALFDQRRIHQVLLNLVSNATKFSPQNTTITIRVSSVDESPQLSHSGNRGDENMVLVSVIDRGMGIPEDELHSVFDEFAQSRKVQSGQFSAGTGLGLAICKQMVQAHGGSIWAESNPEGGAILRFVLPRADAAIA